MFLNLSQDHWITMLYGGVLFGRKRSSMMHWALCLEGVINADCPYGSRLIDELPLRSSQLASALHRMRRQASTWTCMLTVPNSTCNGRRGSYIFARPYLDVTMLVTRCVCISLAARRIYGELLSRFSPSRESRSDATCRLWAAFNVLVDYAQRTHCRLRAKCWLR